MTAGAKDGTTSAMISNQHHPRFLIVRLSHIGDAVLTMPLVSELRQQFPQAYICWAAEPAAAKVIAGHPAIDRLLVVARNWSKSVSGWLRMRRDLRSERFDIAIDPQSLLKSSLLAVLSGAPIRIGMGGTHGREGSRWLNNRLVTPQTNHLVDRTLELLQPLGLDVPATKSFRYPIDEAAQVKIDEYCISNNWKRLVVINPGASWPSKQWIPERFGSVAEHIHQRYGRTVVVTWAGDAERALAERVVYASRRLALAAPATSLPELAALCHRAELFVGCDTGPLHIASAVGTPCIGLYGPTRPQDSGAYGDQHWAIQKWLQRGTKRQLRSGENMAMRDITVNDVCQAVDQFMIRLGKEKTAA